MTLPTDLKDFLLLVIAQPLALGAVVAFLCQAAFTYWEGRTGHPIQSHDKTLITTLTPPVLALLLWALAAGLGFVAWSWPDAAQAVYNGVLASVGGQALYAGFKKILTPAPNTVITQTTTTIGAITATQDVNLADTYYSKQAAPPPDPPRTP